ncbi:MAG: GNAT family N-acetyltransferase [Alphaproteobacteria bacterium]|nr:GNAT family N-acetyltransferase [Alphaproteobacteria bacterium]MDE2630056.1 GNAT family N-acetyltransferase [Alphaproteobacteria bacterium]
MSGVTIRAAHLGDEGAILAFIRELAEYEKLLSSVVATEEDVRAALFGPNPRVFCDIAQSGAEAAGFALWFYTYSTFLARHGIYLEDLFVRPVFRGRGIGKGLMLDLAKRAREEGCGRFEWAVLDWNRPSIAFYESLGARRVEGWQVYRLDGEALKQAAP